MTKKFLIQGLFFKKQPALFPNSFAVLVFGDEHFLVGPESTTLSELGSKEGTTESPIQFFSQNFWREFLKTVT